MGRKINQKQVAVEPVFPIKANLTFVVDGEKFTDEYIVHYRGITAAIQRKINAERIEEETISSTSRELAILVKQIDDVDEVDEKGNVIGPLAMTAAFFEGLLTETRDAIIAAIQEDVQGPNESPSDSAQNG